MRNDVFFPPLIYFPSAREKPGGSASALSCRYFGMSIQLPISIPRYDKFMLLTDLSANINSVTDIALKAPTSLIYFEERLLRE